MKKQRKEGKTGREDGERRVSVMRPVAITLNRRKGRKGKTKKKCDRV